MERMICPIMNPTYVFLIAGSLNSVISYNFKNISSIFIFFLSISFIYLFSLSFGSEYMINAQNQNQTIVGPSLTDRDLRVELVARDFHFPTSIEFLGKDDFLLLEKNTGDIYRILNGNVTGPLIHINVSQKDERGLLGIAILENDNLNKDKDNTFVFLYYTHCPKLSGQAQTSQNCGNYVYRYRFEAENNTLTDPKLILSLPALPGPSHNGGVLELDKHNNLYVTVGDLQQTKFIQNQSVFNTKSQNFINGTAPDGRAGILRVTKDGKPVGHAIIGEKYPINLYFAYGIKNSFGIGFDPLTGNLWDTENGPQFGDEINLVKPGFNSGWEKVQGIWKLNQTREKDGILNESSKEVELVDFNGKGKYSKPEFVWDKTVAPTALIFLDSDKLGKKYKNDIFVGSAKNGRIFDFNLKENRKSLSLSGNLTDLVLNEKDNSSKIIFGKGFGIITDLEVGPDGYLYVVSGFRKTDEGSVYRIIPNLN
ncbi:MAG: PQQ-dependent sugar dehydrogenase [Thaumarchaeota archaeon]|nr:MAG: PQQ-dependent sugar dehydrogenase [Nitrososphaerota archaeon]